MPAVTGTLVPPVLASAPSSPTQGQMYFDSTTKTLYFWSGTAWVSCAGGGAAAGRAFGFFMGEGGGA